MSQRSKIKINGKIYTIRTPESSVDPQELADFVDSRMQKLATAAPKTSTIDLAVLVALNIALEHFQTRDKLEALEQLHTGQAEDWNRRCSGLVEQVRTALS